MAQSASPNRLIHESSPYLLQHAHNPVDWYPWGEVALKKAKEEDKLILVSIGYAACHWCHVMEGESFEDTTVAALMNENFVCIKVDREERPDIDQIYMDACQIVRGNGGWPLNAFALPDGRPVDAMTYLPKANWIKVLEFFKEYYPNQKEEAEKRAKLITDGVRQLELAPTNDSIKASIPEGLLNQAYLEMAESFDIKYGGRQGAPKFPMPAGLDWLLIQAGQAGNNLSGEQLALTLNKMSIGGIYDFLGGGFARYSVDAQWFAPHFEKMLYDNAQLIKTYAEASRFWSNHHFLNIAEETAEFCIRELRDPLGGFYASLDADSEGMEGRFYVWTIEEIEEALPESSIFKKLFDIRYDGNWEHGYNILAQTLSKEEAMPVFGLTESAYNRLMDESKRLLFEKRSDRERPGLDDKILTSWNGLMISGLSSLFKASKKEEHLNYAIQTAEFIHKYAVSPDMRLHRNYKEGKSSINAYLDDYAFTIRGMLDLYECTLDKNWLKLADSLSIYALEHFNDPESPYLYYTSDIDPKLAARKKETGDNVIPSSNAVMAENFWRLGHLLYKEDWIDRSKKMVAGMQEYIRKYPAFYAYWGQLASLQTSSVFEVAIVGPEAVDLMRQMQATYLPNVIYLGSEVSNSELELLKGKWVDGKTLIYVCLNKACQMPVSAAEKAISQIKSKEK